MPRRCGPCSHATDGLIIAEATMEMEGNSSFWMEPGIYTDYPSMAA